MLCRYLEASRQPIRYLDREGERVLALGEAPIWELHQWEAYVDDFVLTFMDQVVVLRGRISFRRPSFRLVVVDSARFLHLA